MALTARLTSVADHARLALYAVALVVSLGSVWTFAWAESLGAAYPTPVYHTAACLPPSADADGAASDEPLPTPPATVDP